MTVHAHPDDESSKGASTVARYHTEGVQTVLVCCTGGEEGDILNPALDIPQVRKNIAEVRREELQNAAKIIGYDQVVMLGYRDSGMDGTPENQNPNCFARADLDEAVGRLVAEIRKYRPHVVVTYDEEQSGYPHPDHLRVHEISVIAFDAAGDANKYQGVGAPWQPLKLYYTVWSMTRLKAMHNKFIELGKESPFDDKWFNRPSREDTITTSIDIAEFHQIRNKALREHRTQIDETSSFWFGLPDEIAKTVHPYDDYALAKTIIGEVALNRGLSERESDLFEGIREPAKN